jgi:3-oxoadipate enol-lactonase
MNTPLISPAPFYAQADDGCCLAVHTLRPVPGSTAAPVLFLHALAMEGPLMWRGTADALVHDPAAAAAPLYALDCRGHGASGKPAGPYTTRRFAQDIGCVLDALEAPRAHLVGCSMGGTVALAFAGLHPERVASLTLLDATAWYGPEAPANWEQRAGKAEESGMAALVEFQRTRWLSPEFMAREPVRLQQALDVFCANDVAAYAATCRMLGAADERAALAAYTGPAEVAVGEQDYATPLAMAEAMAQALAGAHLTVIPAARHFTPLEAPAAVAVCVAKAMARAGRAA